MSTEAKNWSARYCCTDSADRQNHEKQTNKKTVVSCFSLIIS